MAEQQSTTATNTTNVQVIAKADVLGTQVDAVYQKGATRTDMVVYGMASENAPTKTINDFLQEFSGDEGSITGALPDSIGDIGLSLKQVYLKKSMTTGTTAQAAQSTAAKDYAVWIQLNTGSLTEGFPIKVNSVSLKIWTDTAPQSVLDNMKITEMQALLPSPA